MSKKTSKSFTVEAEEFTGQSIDGFMTEHLGVDAKGNPITQIRTNAGGDAVAYYGDYIATFPSGQQVILSRATWHGEKADAYTVINGQRVKVPAPHNAVREKVVEVVPVNPVGAAGWPAKIVEHEVVIQQTVDAAGNAYPETKVARPVEKKAEAKPAPKKAANPNAPKPPAPYVPPSAPTPMNPYNDPYRKS